MLNNTARQLIEARLAAPADDFEEMAVWNEQLDEVMAAMQRLRHVIHSSRRPVDENLLFDLLDAAQEAAENFLHMLDLPAFDHFFDTATGGESQQIRTRRLAGREAANV